MWTTGLARGGLLDCIGQTPLFLLRGPSAATGCEIYGKAEFMNPGQSVKDRAALALIRDAEARELLRPGGTIVEGTAGNTGIGLAMIGAFLGYRVIVVMPRNQSQEKKDAVRLLGAKLVEVEPAPYSSPHHYVKHAAQLAHELNAANPGSAVWANQFDNVANRAAHARTTGPEIWDQMQGRIDGFICAVGSGGTLAGVSQALRARSAAIRIGLADPMGAALFSYFTTGVLKSDGNSISEGIGQGRITANLEGLVVDHAYQVGDAEMLDTLFGLVQTDGLCLGGSAGINVAGAVKLARELGPGHRIVTILCDLGTRYQGKLYNPDFLQARGLPTPDWMIDRVSA